MIDFHTLLMSRRYVIIEFLLLCIMVPGILIFGRFAPMMFVFLWGAAVYSFLVLRYVERLDLRTLWRWDAVTWDAMRPVLIRWVLATLAMCALCLLIAPDRFLALPQRNMMFVLVLCLVYPVLSALPQELIFCSFFFKRYGRLFGTGLGIVIASAIVFAYAHVLYINWVAPILSLLAGLLFAQTYRQSKSLALVTIEHGLYGNSLFIIGLGWYFYGGGVN